MTNITQPTEIKMKKEREESCDLSNKTLDIILDSIEEESDLVGNIYELKEMLGEGSFGKVYRAINVKEKEKNNEYAIKLETKKDVKKHLLKEYFVYKGLDNSNNFPKMYWYGNYKKYRGLVLDRLGPSLKYFFVKYKYNFDMNTIANIAVQVLYRLEELHNKGFLHQDIKPENILVDYRNMVKIFLVDYGTSGEWRVNNSSEHVEQIKSNKIVGTARYSSINNHSGMLQSRCDDLQSFGYVLIYLAKSSLPWQGFKTRDFRRKWKQVQDIKEGILLTKLCDGIPYCFLHYFEYISKLSFKEKPDYKYLRSLFRVYIKSDFVWKI